MENNGALLGIGLVAGVALGLTVGLLYAPRSGRKTRALIKGRAMEIKEKTGEMAEEMKERAGTLMSKAKGRMCGSPEAVK